MGAGLSPCRICFLGELVKYIRRGVLPYARLCTPDCHDCRGMAWHAVPECATTPAPRTTTPEIVRTVIYVMIVMIVMGMN